MVAMDSITEQIQKEPIITKRLTLADSLSTENDMRQAIQLLVDFSETLANRISNLEKPK